MLDNFKKPLIMGIANGTTDSFYADSRFNLEKKI